MRNICILLDYKNRFETKYTAVPYRSGINKNLLLKYFEEENIYVTFSHFHEIDFRDSNLKDQIFLYSSSEDRNGFYKSYIEDVILGLTLAGAIVIPEFTFLRAHNNKVLMEIMRDLSQNEKIKNIKSKCFGSLEELLLNKNIFVNKQTVIKPASGAMSKGVALSGSLKQLIAQAKNITQTKHFKSDIRDYLRKRKHKGYSPDSQYRKKFITQNLIPNLSGDFKILVYGKKYYILHRTNRENDFRASGGGLLKYTKDIPVGILDFAKGIYDSFHVPNISLDIAFDGNSFYLFEFQSVYFGTYTIEHSEFYFVKQHEEWNIIEEKSILEKEYVRSVSDFIRSNIS